MVAWFPMFSQPLVVHTSAQDKVQNTWNILLVETETFYHPMKFQLLPVSLKSTCISECNKLDTCMVGRRKIIRVRRKKSHSRRILETLQDKILNWYILWWQGQNISWSKVGPNEYGWVCGELNKPFEDCFLHMRRKRESATFSKLSPSPIQGNNRIWKSKKKWWRCVKN